MDFLGGNGFINIHHKDRRFRKGFSPKNRPGKIDFRAFDLELLAGWKKVWYNSVGVDSKL